MKKLLTYLAILATACLSALAPFVGLALVAVAPGCQASPERLAFTTVKAANLAVATAMDAYHFEMVRREVANEKTVATDPAGYADRKREMALLDTHVKTALAEYQSATKAAIHLWLAVKANGSHAPPDASATAEVTRALAEVLKLTQLLKP